MQNLFLETTYQNIGQRIEKLKPEGRVHAVVPANYTEGADLDQIIKANIDSVAARSVLLDLLGEEAP